MSTYDRDQLQPQETLDDTGVDDPLDEGYSPPEKLRGSTAKGVTQYEQEVGETLDERLAQEEPDVGLEEIGQLEDDPVVADQVGGARSGRLVEPDQGAHDDLEKDLVAEDIGIDGAGASAEEAAVHVIDET